LHGKSKAYHALLFEYRSWHLIKALHFPDITCQGLDRLLGWKWVYIGIIVNE
jgi:hypothetical protein